MLLLLIATLTLFASVASTDLSDDSVLIPGDITLGGLFPVTDNSNCSTISFDRGIQRMEAMILSLKEVNSDKRLLRYGKHKITLGALLLDTCFDTKTALQKAIRFVPKLSWSSDGNWPSVADFFCPKSNSDAARKPAVRVGSPIRGVVGPTYSHITMRIVQILSLFDIPVLSYAASTPELSDRTLFPMFARPLPSDSEQGRVLADIVAQFKQWNFIITISSERSFADLALRSFQESVKKRGICIAQHYLLSRDARPRQLETITHALKSLSKDFIVVLFLPFESVKVFIEAARQAGVSPGRFVWLSMDLGLSGNEGFAFEGNSEIFNGAITIRLDIPQKPNFDKYFTSLKPKLPRMVNVSSGPRFAYFNRYFDQFWQQRFNCTLEKSRNASNIVSKSECSDSLRIDPGLFRQQWKIQFVSDAVFTFAHALDKIIDRVCSPQDPNSDTKSSGAFEECVKNVTNFPGSDLYDIIVSKNNSFVNQAGSRVEYHPNGDGMASYTIYNYQRNSSSGWYEHVPVGKWSSSFGLSLNAQDIVWPRGGSEPPTSSCSAPCPEGSRKMKDSSYKDCDCWVCVDTARPAG